MATYYPEGEVTTIRGLSEMLKRLPSATKLPSPVLKATTTKDDVVTFHDRGETMFRQAAVHLQNALVAAPQLAEGWVKQLEPVLESCEVPPAIRRKVADAVVAKLAELDAARVA